VVQRFPSEVSAHTAAGGPGGTYEVEVTLSLELRTTIPLARSGCPGAAPRYKTRLAAAEAAATLT